MFYDGGFDFPVGWSSVSDHGVGNFYISSL